MILATLKTAPTGTSYPSGRSTSPSSAHPSRPTGTTSPASSGSTSSSSGSQAAIWPRAIGLFAASNLVLLLAHVLAACSFYGVARYFRARPEWALAGACVFAFSPYLFYRSSTTST